MGLVLKACRNCRSLYGDDYAGQCTDCGAPMAGVAANTASDGSGGNDLAFAFANQIAQGRREAQMEQSLKQGAAYKFRIGDRGPAGLNSNVVELAKTLLVPKEGAFTDDAPEAA